MVQIFIPTLGRETIKDTLNALKTQTFKDFEIILISKKQLNINGVNKIIIQKEGYFEEAINLALENLNPDDIALFTDDDAIPSSKWIEDYLEFHEKNPSIYIASGEVIGEKWKNYPNALFQRYKNTKYMMPYNSKFSEYTGFLTKVGLSVDRDDLGTYEVEKSLAIAGVNMSLKTNFFLEYKIPTFTLRGSYNESVLALHGIYLGGDSATFKGAKVYHKGNESLSRTKDPHIEKYLCLEKHVFPYAVNTIFKIDINLLDEFISLLEEGIPKLGLSLALKGIVNNYTFLQFRKELLRLYELRETIL
ncbi:MAG: glycosyltransferase [Acidianus sp.]|jgi:glycosyltransferase involved in cell wall biosynthesis|nr:glycosyltransferase [Acidianus sp.]